MTVKASELDRTRVNLKLVITMANARFAPRFDYHCSLFFHGILSHFGAHELPFVRPSDYVVFSEPFISAHRCLSIAISIFFFTIPQLIPTARYGSLYSVFSIHLTDINHIQIFIVADFVVKVDAWRNNTPDTRRTPQKDDRHAI